MPTTQTLYEQDFYAWSNEQAKLLKANKFDQLDWENLSEEIEDMGKSEKRAFESTLIDLLLHMLKYKYQTNLKNINWEILIRKQRRIFKKILKESPSLKQFLQNEKFLENIFQDALLEAQIDTGLSKNIFPKTCEWTIEQILNDEFVPN